MRRLFTVALFGVVLVTLSTAVAEAQQPQPTPPPAPADVHVDQSTTIVGPDGQYLSPGDRTWTVTVAWTVEPGFSGTFDVERSGVDADGERLPFAKVVTLPATVTSYVETFPFWALNAERCYRVRTTVNGETGPYSEAACTVQPPTSGHGGVPDDAPFFYPPDVAARTITTDITGNPLDEAAYEIEVTVTWREFPGFSGVFEVERATSFDVDAKHDFRLVATVTADDRRFVDRFPAGEQYTKIHCYRVRTLREGAYGPYTPLNCHIPPTGGPGAILRPPVGMSMFISAAAAGLRTATVTWDPWVGYSGQFEVQRSVGTVTGDFVADFARVKGGPFERVAVQAADNRQFSESFPEIEEFTVIRCYRVRAVAEGLEGPFGRVSCTVPPPGGIPLPPDTGSGRAPLPAYVPMLPLVGAGIAFIAAAALAGVSFARGGRAPIAGR